MNRSVKRDMRNIETNGFSFFLHDSFLALTESNEQDGELELNVESIKNKGQISEVSTEFFGLKLFSEKFEARINDIHQSQQAGREEQLENLFLQEDIKEVASTANTLFREEIVITNVPYKQEFEYPLWLSWGILMFLLIGSILISYKYFNRRKK